MAEELTMPRLSDTMEEGTIARWVKQVGDEVKEGDVLAEIETDKATMEFQAYSDGTLLEILVNDGESVGLGEPIAIMGAPGEKPGGDGGSKGKQDGEEAAGDGAEDAATEGEDEPAAGGDGEGGDGESAQEDADDEAEGERQDAQASSHDGDGAEDREPDARGEAEARPSAGRQGLRVSPIARRMADEAGIDLSSLAGRGSGPDGRVVKADVERLMKDGGRPAREQAAPAGEEATAKEKAPAEEPRRAQAPSEPYPGVLPVEEEARVEDAPRLLRAVARRMAEASSTIPHFYVSNEVDMTRAMALRRELNDALADSGEKVSVNDLVLRAAALSLMQHPQAHRSWLDGKLAYHQHAHVGMAVALEDGLIVPVVRQADSKGLRQISREARDLAKRAREGKLRQPEIEGGTFTVSNLGMFDVTAFMAIINPPEPGILAVGSVVERAAVEDGAVVAKPMMSMTLSCDHRACSGADGARLLQTIKRHLEAPALLVA
jgi:pyruvate dehydrogenase E2 component (dihydrolipoamide acetyltransferase)